MAQSLNTKSFRAAQGVTINHAEMIEAPDDFASLLAELGAAPDMNEVIEVIRVAEVETATNDASAVDDSDFASLLEQLGAADIVVLPVFSAKPATDDEVLAAVVSSEATDVMVAAARNEVVLGDAVPTSGEIAAPKVEAKGKKEKAEKVAKTPKTPKTPKAPKEPKAPKAEKTPAAPRKHYSDKVERLTDRMGDKLGEYTVLTGADADVEDDAALAAVTASTMNIIRAMNSKEQNRATGFLEFLSGRKSSLNKVLGRVLTVLERDGAISTGVEGNVIKDLLSAPYSLASARAMSGNTIGMFADLKVITSDGKGKFIANTDSLLLMKAKSLMTATA
jgi:hypothetical protein